MSYTPKAQLDRIVRRMDRLWRRAVLSRAGNTCELCGAPTASDRASGALIWVQACHIIGRGDWATRWDPRNGVAGCQRCHCDPMIMAWLGETDPDRYDWIMARKYGPVIQRRDIDLGKILITLEAA